MYSNGVPWRLKLAASALVSPLMLAPAVTITAMFWARSEWLLLHPDRAVGNPPTVSRAISDPAVGDIFALWMFVVAGLQGFAVLRLAQATYRTALTPFPARHGGLMWGLLVSILLCQATGIAGAITLSQWTGFYSDDLHQLGSYMLFFGNGVSIALFGALISLDRNLAARGDTRLSALPRPYDFYIHTRSAWIVTSVGVLFFVLFTWFDFFASFSLYGTRVAFVTCELVLLVGSLVYLGCFLVTMYRHELHLLVHGDAQRETIQTAGA